MSQRKVVILGFTFNYEDKAPFEKSGRSLWGALETDEAGEHLKCHLCGDWHGMLGQHLRWSHAVSIREYKISNGLALKTSLLAPARRVRRAAISINGPGVAALRQRMNIAPIEQRKEWLGKNRQKSSFRPEFQNFRRKCRLQLVEAIREIAVELGRTPLGRDLVSHGIRLQYMTKLFEANGIDEVMEACGLDPNGNKSKNVLVEYSREILIELLRDAHVKKGEPLRMRDCKAPMLPSMEVFRRIFGGWSQALEAAGLGLTIQQRQEGRELTRQLQSAEIAAQLLEVIGSP